METLTDVRARLTSATEQLPVVAPWSPGVTMAHCAQSIEFLLDGFPQLRSIVVRRIVGPLVARRFLRTGAMSHDTDEPIPGAPPIDPDTTWEQGRDLLVAAIKPLRGPQRPHAGALRVRTVVQARRGSPERPARQGPPRRLTVSVRGSFPDGSHLGTRRGRPLGRPRRP